MTIREAGRVRRIRRQRGLTLLELLIVLGITAVLATSISYAMMAEVSLQRRLEADRATADRRQAMVTEITRLISGIKFVGPVTSTTTTTSTSTTATSTTNVGTNLYFQGINDGGQGLTGCDRLTFTTTTPGVPLASINSTDDFQTQQNARGPVGGVSEVSIGVQPVGQAPAGQTGLFERMQTPSDTDPTQGGYEWMLDPNVDQIGFEFWDGQSWQTTWDTTNGQTVLPQMIRVSYTIKNEDGRPVHTFTVPIPASTVNAQNIVPAGTSTTTTSTATATAGGSTAP